MSEPTIKPIPVLEFLARQVGSHAFSGERQQTNRSNFECLVERSVVLECAGSKWFTIPTGSTLVVYRSPELTYEKGATIACFNHASGDKQTVIYNGGIARIKETGIRMLHD